MKVYPLDGAHAGHVAELMHAIRPEWWPTFEDAYDQLTDIGASIKTVG